MTEQQRIAKERAEVMLAFSEGKVIEFQKNGSNLWEIGDSFWWDWSRYDYRIAPNQPKPKKLVPFTFKDAEQLIGKVIKGRTYGVIYLITGIGQEGVYVSMEGERDYLTLMRNFTFYPSGEPCGKWEEEE